MDTLISSLLVLLCFGLACDLDSSIQRDIHSSDASTSRQIDVDAKTNDDDNETTKDGENTSSVILDIKGSHALSLQTPVAVVTDGDIISPGGKGLYQVVVTSGDKGDARWAPDTKAVYQEVMVLYGTRFDQLSQAALRTDDSTPLVVRNQLWAAFVDTDCTDNTGSVDIAIRDALITKDAKPQDIAVTVAADAHCYNLEENDHAVVKANVAPGDYFASAGGFASYGKFNYTEIFMYYFSPTGPRLVAIPLGGSVMQIEIADAKDLSDFNVYAFFVDGVTVDNNTGTATIKLAPF